MSSILGGKGGLGSIKGGASGTAGLTPQEQQLVQFTQNEGKVKAAQDFSGGMGMSTNATMGAQAGMAAGTMQGMGIADANAASQQASDVALASLAGQALSGSGGGSTGTSAAAGTLSGADPLTG